MGFHKSKTMKLEIGKTYLTKHGRFVKIKEEPWEGIFNGEYEKDGRDDFTSRWKTDGRAWNFLFMSGEFYTPEHNILMEDCKCYGNGNYYKNFNSNTTRCRNNNCFLDRYKY